MEKIKIIRPACRVVWVQPNEHLVPAFLEYDIRGTFFFGLLAWAAPNRLLYNTGQVEALRGFGCLPITTWALRWCRLEDIP